MYSSLTKRVKIYHDVEFHEYEITYNADISNEFQYTEFDEYEESETVEIDISKSTDQNTFIKPSIESSAEAQNINSFNAFYNASPEIMNTNIISHHLKCNQQPTCH